MATPKLLITATVPSTLRAFLLPFAAHFRALGWRVDAAAAGVSGCADCCSAFDRVYDLPLSRNPWQPGALFRAAREIRELVRREDYDLVHTHTPVASFVTRFALRKLRRSGRPKVIYTAHGFHFHSGGSRFKNALFTGLEKRAGRWTDYLVVINRDDEQAARRLRLVAPERIVCMPGIGVDWELYAPHRVSPEDVARVRAELNLRSTRGNEGLTEPRTPNSELPIRSEPPHAGCYGSERGDVLFLMIAEFNPGKRHRDAILAFRSLPPHAHLAFAGDGPLRRKMEELVKSFAPALPTNPGARISRSARSGSSALLSHPTGEGETDTLASRIHFLGSRHDIPALIRASLATLLPSEREGLPRSIMESFCLEVPVIGTNIRGIRDLVGDDCGLLVQVGNPAVLGRAMQQLLDHPEQALALGKRGREKMAAFDVRHVLKLHEELYRRAMEQAD